MKEITQGAGVEWEGRALFDGWSEKASWQRWPLSRDLNNDMEPDLSI